MGTDTAQTQRFCSKCGQATVAAQCPHDGAPTFTRGSGDGVVSLKLKPGDAIAHKYKVVKQLGKGGFGAVYQAEHTTTGQQVAVKILALDPDDGDDSVVARFLQEAQITGKLRHPNTVRVFDFGQTDDSALFMVLELLNGPTLEKVLKDQAKNDAVMSERQACNIAIPVLRSLTEAHDAGLVHRDLKPLNIMLADSGDDDPVVKVLDFGIARKQDSDLTGAGKALGTPAYMSPEQCKGGDIDGRSDVYSLGCILFRCVTGQLPFHTDNQLALLQAHILQAPPPVKSLAKTKLSDGFAAVVDRALVKDPRARFESARAMRQELEAVLGGAWGGTPVRPLPAMSEAESAETAAVDTGQLAAATGRGAKAASTPDAATVATDVAVERAQAARAVSGPQAAVVYAGATPAAVATPAAAAPAPATAMLDAAATQAVAAAAVQGATLAMPAAAAAPAKSKMGLWIGVAVAAAIAVTIAVLATGGSKPPA
ncbi:MAG: protein kinase, partial [Deltaproteobacteria bacterium]|nr:protein kinase [Deltaproteobacteria bacterium]